MSLSTQQVRAPRVRCSLRLGLALLAAASLALSTACSRSSGSSEKKEAESEDEAAGVPVELASVEILPLSSYFESTTTLEPEKDAQILAKITSQIVRILVEEGDAVEKGRVLAVLDDREWALALEEANLQTETWKREVERLESIHEQHLISEKELDDARHQYRIYETQGRKAELQLSYTRVAAPFSGTVTKRLGDVGDNVTVGTPLFEISDIDPVRARLYLPEKIASEIRIDQVVSLVPDAAPRLSLPARVARVAPIVDTRTGTVKVTVELTEPLPLGVPIGTFVRARITIDTRHRATAVPKRALVTDLGETFLFVAEADSVRRVKVELGYQGDEHVEVLAGVVEGDRVVVVGQGSLRDGSKIRPMPGGEPAAGSTPEEDSLVRGEVDEGGA